MRGSNSRITAFFCFAFFVMGPYRLAFGAPVWESKVGELGEIASKTILTFNVHYADIGGSELQRVDPGVGARGSVAYRIRSAFSVVVSAAYTKSTVDGPTSNFLDTVLREDSRAAALVGDFASTRVGAGLRFDSISKETWRARPYVDVEALWSMSKIDVETIDSVVPTEAVRKTIDDDTWGVLGRVGIDYRLTSQLGIDLSGTHEVLSLPAGAGNMSSVQGGISFRI